MGKKAREIVGEDVEEIIKLLKKAYADEWIAYFYYELAALLLEGPESKGVAEEIKRIAGEEKEHADELAERIVQLGGEPIKDFGEIVKMANCPTVNFPEDFGDVKGVLKALVEAEGCAIEVYQSLLKKILNKDFITMQLVTHILGEEITHEDTFSSLLGEK
ncbi:MAG: ferritin-like domain-containing protein [Candidatus Asgardarchaeia archaeon]